MRDRATRRERKREVGGTTLGETELRGGRERDRDGGAGARKE